MIPIRDTIPARHYPLVTYALIGVNVLVFLVQLGHGPGEAREFILIYGLVPARYTVGEVAAHFTLGQQIFALLSFMFLHGGFFHLIFNMWSLYIFGDNVEDHLGSAYFLLFYIAAGLVSGLFHLFLNPTSTTPVIGASGAIAGVMGAYFILYPHSRILTLIPIFFIPFFVHIPAFFFLGLWFFLQLLNAAGAQAQQTGIAWWAHIGGFVFGVVALKMFGFFPSDRTEQGYHRGGIRRKTSDRLQLIRPSAGRNSLDLYETLQVTPYEAAAGARKLVNIPQGVRNRMYRVVIPPGTHDGSVLRLKGMGKQDRQGKKGDLYLKVLIEQPW
ncbi:MAG: rhomboid family intramembrane serine protease [Desulfobacteraceae bacterium]|nr:rhomboid family intramembrane serine protease [Desulfobacteraceae bacterium]MCF8096100.1 rhomboid family intramembrane serine protease [Desulfobacteraceae bacterium]